MGELTQNDHIPVLHNFGSRTDLYHQHHNSFTNPFLINHKNANKYRKTPVDWCLKFDFYNTILSNGEGKAVYGSDGCLIFDISNTQKFGAEANLGSGGDDKQVIFVEWP